MRRERPRCCSAAEKRDEFASLHCAVSPVLATRRIAHLDTAETAALRDFDLAYVGSGSSAPFRSQAPSASGMTQSADLISSRSTRLSSADTGLMTLRQMSTAHSMSESARTRNNSGIVTPMALAVFRLMANSNFVGCSMGRSFGCCPCKILCTYLAPCRNKAAPSAP